MRNKAETITRNEWKEISMLPVVQKIFGLTVIPDFEAFASRVYGAKFILEDSDFQYTVYTLMGTQNKHEALVLERVKGVLQEMEVE